LCLQSPWLLRLEMDRAKMADRKLTMEFVAYRIKENSKSELFIIRSKDNLNSEELIVTAVFLALLTKMKMRLGR
jgi:DNA-directed RNA polymerase II subunit RPB1